MATNHFTLAVEPVYRHERIHTTLAEAETATRPSAYGTSNIGQRMTPTLSFRSKLPAFDPTLVPCAFKYAIVESAAEIRFIELSTQGLLEVAAYPKGVAFSDEAELRWVKRQSGWHFVLLSDSGQVLQDSGSQTLTYIEQATFQLRGKKEDEQILEGRIPNPIEYPIAHTHQSSRRQNSRSAPRTNRSSYCSAVRW